MSLYLGNSKVAPIIKIDPNLQIKSVIYTPTTNEQSGVIIPDQGYEGLERVNVAVLPYSYSWLGKNPELIYQSDAIKTFFKDTGWKTWTPTTTSTALDAATNYTSFSADLNTYEYYIHTRVYEEITYDGEETNVAKLNRGMTDQWFTIIRYPSNYTNITNRTDNANTSVSTLTRSITDYYNASGVQTIVYSWGYGLYPSATVPSFSNSTTLTPTIYIKVPALNARCSNTYLTTANAEHIDADKSFFILKYEAYRVDKDTTGIRVAQDDCEDMFFNGLT